MKSKRQNKIYLFQDSSYAKKKWRSAVVVYELVGNDDKKDATIPITKRKPDISSDILFLIEKSDKLRFTNEDKDATKTNSITYLRKDILLVPLL